MDALDLELLRALGIEAWAVRDRRPEATRAVTLAKRLNVRDELVRERIARMEASGVIAGYEIYPNFKHLGLEAKTFHFRLPPDGPKAIAMDEAVAFEGVFGVYGYLGPQVCVDICSRNDAERDRRLDVLSKLMGNARPMVVWERTLPEVNRSLDLLDWRIIAALRGNARRPLEEVAEDVGTSVRTVRRRLARLQEEGSVDIIAQADPTAMEGALVVEFHVQFDDAPEAVRREALAILNDHWLSAWTPPDAEIAGLVVALMGPSIAHFESLRAQLERLKQVRSVRVLVPSRVAYDGSWIDEAIAERISALDGDA